MFTNMNPTNNISLSPGTGLEFVEHFTPTKLEEQFPEEKLLSSKQDDHVEITKRGCTQKKYKRKNSE